MTLSRSAGKVESGSSKSSPTVIPANIIRILFESVFSIPFQNLLHLSTSKSIAMISRGNQQWNQIPRLSGTWTSIHPLNYLPPLKKGCILRDVTPGSLYPLKIPHCYKHWIAGLSLLEFCLMGVICPLARCFLVAVTSRGIYFLLWVQSSVAVSTGVACVGIKAQRCRRWRHIKCPPPSKCRGKNATYIFVDPTKLGF